MLHKETVKGETFRLLTRLMQDVKLNRFHLAGGTALALYIGHRISIDLDLFCTESFDVKDLREYMTEKYDFQESFFEKNTLMGSVNGIKVDCITHNYPLIEPVKTYENGIRLFSIPDISAMKLSAITDNGTRLKDFIDIACLSVKLSLKDMLEAYQNKFHKTNCIIPLKGLTYFEDINFQEPIQMCGSTFQWQYIEKRLYDMIEQENKRFYNMPLAEKKSKDMGMSI